MEHVEIDYGGALRASATAGPLFTTAAALAGLYLQIPAPVVIEAKEVAAFVLFLVPATIVGFFLALVPTLVGTAGLAFAGRHLVLARLPLVWLLVGAGLGAILVRLIEAQPPPLAFGFIAASAVCAAICRRGVKYA